MDHLDRYERILRLVTEDIKIGKYKYNLKDELYKFYVHNNKSAGIRIRKIMQMIRKESVLIRKDVEIYKKCFESIGLFDYKYRLWKSNPQIPIDNKDAFKASVGAYFNYLFSKYKEDNIW